MNTLVLHWKDIKNPNAGGGTRYAHQIAQKLSEEHDVTLLSYRFPGSPKKTTINENYTIHRRGNKISYHLKAPLYLLKHRREYDLILDSVILAPKLLLCSHFCKAKKIALVHQFFQRVIKEQFSKLFSLPIGLFEKLWPPFYRNFTMVAVSESIRRKLLKRGAKDVKVIPPGLQIEKYEYHPKRKAKTPLLIYIGRLKKYKGIQYGIKAMQHVLNSFPNATFLIAGRGDYKQNLQSLITKLDLGSHVELLGYVSEKKKAEMLKRAHLFLFPSIAEGWGISAIEAQACGIPVVGTNTDGLQDSIKDRKTGRLVPYGKPKKIAKEIIALLSNSERRKQLAENAYTWAQRFSWEHTLERLLQLLTS